MKAPEQSTLEIDLRVIIVNLWKGRKLILFSCVFCSVLGLFIAFTSPPQYQSHCTLIAEGRQNGNSSLGRVGGLLSSLAGVNLDLNGTNSLTPEFYPHIAASTPFLLEILEKPIHYGGLDTTISTKVYFEEYAPSSPIGTIQEYVLGLPNKIKGLFSANEIDQPRRTQDNTQQVLHLSKDEMDMVEDLRNRLVVDADLKTGIVTIRCEMPDSEASANIAYEALELLKTYIMRQQQLKAASELAFIEKSYEDADKTFQESQQALAQFKDQNQFMSNDRALIELRRLEAEYSIAFDLFRSLSTKLIEAQIKVKENTPVFALIDQPTVPLLKASPKRKVILIVSLILGGFLGIGLIMVKWLLKFVRDSKLLQDISNS